MNYGKKGFTLVEAMVVVSILSFLASVVTTPLNTAKTKGTDSRRIQDFHNIKLALNQFYLEYGRYPHNYARWNGVNGAAGVFVADPVNTPVPPGWQVTGACDAPVKGLIGADPATYPNYINNVVPEAFYASMQELVDAGFLAEVPKSPPGGSGYCYYRYASTPPAMAARGGVIVTALESGDPTTTGIPPSCRYFPGVGDWCSSTVASRVYCLCNPY